MEEEDQRELQLLPSPSSTCFSSRTSGASGRTCSLADTFEGPLSLDLQLSISLGSIEPTTTPARVHHVRNTLYEPHHYQKHHGNMKIDFRSSIEVLKWQTAEQIRLASAERAYAERVKELTRREMELAQSEFARARQIWERARQEVEKAERIKERASRHIDSTCIEITCQICRQLFRP